MIKLPSFIAKSTGCSEDEARRFLKWMDETQLTFAPACFQPTIDAIANVARRHP